MRHQLMILSLGLAAGIVRTAAAQAFPVTAGEWVRIHAADSALGIYEGVVRGQDSVGLVLGDNQGRQVRIPADSIARLERRRMKRQTGKGALVGGVLGAAMGLAIGPQVKNEPLLNDEPGAGVIAASIGICGAAGAATGAIIGTFVHGATWEPVAPQPRRVVPLATGFEGRTVVGVSLRF